MATKTRTELKAYFETGDKPTQQQFADFIESVPNKQDEVGSFREYVALVRVTDGVIDDTTVLNNTIGSIAVSRYAAGVYRLISSALFTTFKTMVWVSSNALADSGDEMCVISSTYFSANIIEIQTTNVLSFAAVDVQSGNFYIMVRQYD